MAKKETTKEKVAVAKKTAKKVVKEKAEMPGNLTRHGKAQWISDNK
jgi:hypothetical protein